MENTKKIIEDTMNGITEENAAEKFQELLKKEKEERKKGECEFFAIPVDVLMDAIIEKSEQLLDYLDHMDPMDDAADWTLRLGEFIGLQAIYKATSYMMKEMTPALEDVYAQMLKNNKGTFN